MYDILTMIFRVQHKNFGPLVKLDECHRFSLAPMTFQLAQMNNFTFHINL